MSNIPEIEPLINILTQFQTYINLKNKWIPCWKRSADRIPMPCTYEWRDKDSNALIFMVEVSKSGAIHVLEEDWLSKYTMAIHQTINVSNLFIRIDQETGECSEIENVDKIYEGEVILHFPSLLNYVAWLQKEHYTNDGYPITLPPVALKELFFVKGHDPLGPFSGPLSNFVKSLEGMLGKTPMGPIVTAVTSVKHLPKIVDVNRSLAKELMIEKFYAGIVAQVYWVFTDTEIDYSKRIPTIIIEDSDTDNQILKPFIPSIPVPINHAFGNPKQWIFNYGDNYFYNYNFDQIKSKLESMKAIWEENFNGNALVNSAFNILENAYTEAKMVTREGRPNLPKLTFKKEMRTYGNYQLSVSEFYEIRCQALIATIKKEWMGDPWIIKDLVDFVSNPNKHYKLEHL